MTNTNFWLGKRVLLTGHTGFKGCWLLVWLQELGAEVWCYSLEPNDPPNLFKEIAKERPAGKNWHHTIGDIREGNKLSLIIKQSQPEIVFHLAAQALVQNSYVDPIGTWSTNVQGSLHLLEGLKQLKHQCAVVMITTDKVYRNNEWGYGYRENDRLGGHDPYSSSKAAAEIAISSWRASFCGNGREQTPFLKIASARAGNVIGGGDWAPNRIIPDTIRALSQKKVVTVRNPSSTRPWQHVLEPLSGYLLLAEQLAYKPDDVKLADAFNFGPKIESNTSVENLIREVLKHWDGKWTKLPTSQALHEARSLHLNIDKAYNILEWSPQWNFSKTVERTIRWYKKVLNGESSLESCLSDLALYNSSKNFPSNQN